MIPKDYKEDGGETGGKKRKSRKRMRKAMKTMVGRKRTVGGGFSQLPGGGFGGGGRVPGSGGKGP